MQNKCTYSNANSKSLTCLINLYLLNSGNENTEPGVQLKTKYDIFSNNLFNLRYLIYRYIFKSRIFDYLNTKSCELILISIIC